MGHELVSYVQSDIHIAQLCIYVPLHKELNELGQFFYGVCTGSDNF